MTNHPNRNWRSRWTVDKEREEARHGPSGLAVRFAQTDEPGAWAGQPTNAQEAFQGLLRAHGADDATRMLARLLREAGDIWNERDDR